MKLKTLKMKGLFGHFQHELSFKKENITIITAPNGYGKTVCLKIIDSIFNRRLSYFSELQFENITLETSNGILEINKEEVKNIDGKEETPRTFTLDFKDSNGEDNLEQYTFTRKRKGSLHRIEVHVPFLTRIGPREWEDIRTDEILDYDEVLDKYADELPDEFTTKDFPEWYVTFSDSLNAHFIQDQRLILKKIVHNRGRPSKKFIDTIEMYADELSNSIKDYGYLSSHVSQELDSTFPVRLLKKNSNFKALEIDQLKDALRTLQQKRKSLSEFNLLSSEKHIPRLKLLDDIKDEDKKVLTLYVEDTKKKLAAYDDIFKKIELFSRILNNKRLSFKHVKIDAEKGFYFTTDQKRPLSLTQLSSGEQHQVVLLYELIFKTKENILVLIDEPEISLHVAWQKEFLNDLKEIIEIQNMPVVIATHSPQIIGGNWNLTVDLEGDEL